MMKFIIVCWLAGLLSACSELPRVKNLPSQPQTSRMFKVEQFDEKGGLHRTSLLVVEFMPQKWRWVQTDPLGSPVARVVLTSQGWQNDGFVMPNKQSVQFFSALTTTLAANAPVFDFSAVTNTPHGKCYEVNHRKAWCIGHQQSSTRIFLPDHTQWRIEELKVF